MTDSNVKVHPVSLCFQQTSICPRCGDAMNFIASLGNGLTCIQCVNLACDQCYSRYLFSTSTGQGVLI